jgi:hypothetical protein
MPEIQEFLFIFKFFFSLISINKAKIFDIFKNDFVFFIAKAKILILSFFGSESLLVRESVLKN